MSVPATPIQHTSTANRLLRIERIERKAQRQSSESPLFTQESPNTDASALAPSASLPAVTVPEIIADTASTIKAAQNQADATATSVNQQTQLLVDQSTHIAVDINAEEAARVDDPQQAEGTEAGVIDPDDDVTASEDILSPLETEEEDEADEETLDDLLVIDEAEHDSDETITYEEEAEHDEELADIPLGDDDVFDLGGGGSVDSDGLGAAAVASLRQQALSHVAAIPATTVGSGGGGGAIESEAQRRARLTDVTSHEAAAGAQAQVPPIPSDLAGPPAPTDENPVPTAMYNVNQVGNRRLPEQTPPVLPSTGTPLGNPLRLDAIPLSEDQLTRAHAARPPDPAAPPTPAAGPASAPGSEAAREAARQEQERQAILQLRERLLTPPEVPALQRQPTALVDAPPPHAAVTPAIRGQAAEVYARLLARPEVQSRTLFRRVQRTVFGAAAGGGSDVGNYGEEQYLPDLQRDFVRSVRDIAAASGIATADLDTAITDRRAELAAAEAAAAAAVNNAATTGTNAVTTAGDNRTVATAGHHARLLAQADATAAQPTTGLGGGIAGTRDRLIADLRAREAEIDAGFRLSLQRRETALTDAATRQNNAYRAGSQVDHFQLLEISSLSAAQQTAAAAAYQRMLRAAPATANTLSTSEAAQLLPRIDAWGQDQGAGATATINRYKTTAQTETRTNREALRTAGKDAVEAVRAWAAEKLGQHRGWFTRLIERIMDWVEQLRTNADTWRAAQDRETASSTTDNIDFINRIAEAERNGITREALLEGNNLTEEQRSLINQYFSPGGRNDPLQLIANRTLEEIFDSRREGLVSGLTSTFENDTALTPGQVEALVGGGVNGKAEAIHAAMYGRGTWGGLDAVGTDEAAIYSNMTGLTPIQMVGLKKCYFHRFHHSLDVALRDELGGQELQRAQDLASGDAVGAATAALYSAMHETFLGTGAGTDEQAIHDILRGLTPEQRIEVERMYRERYGLELSGDMRGELNDWSTMTTHEADRADAELAGNLELADAIELNQISTTTIFHTNTVNEMGAVYERLEREVRAQATREGRSSLWVSEELARRRGLIETSHNDRYAHTDAGGNRTGTLRDAFANAATQEHLFWGGRPEHRDAGENLLNALADGDEARAAGARIRLERTSLIYAEDRAITDTYRSQYDVSLADARLDLEAGIRRRLMEELERSDQPPNQLTPAERFRRERAIDHQVETELVTEARRRSTLRVEAMERTYESDYHESAATVIEENTSGVDRDMARSLRTQGGYLEPIQRLDYSSRGGGTREDEMVNATAGMTRAEIAELDREWQRTHRNDDGTPQTLADLGRDELSGTDLGRYQIATLGVPQTIDEELDVLRARVAWETPTSSAGEHIASYERDLMTDQLNRMEAMRDEMSRTDLSREERDAYVGAYVHQADVVNSSVDNYRDVRNAIVDSITTGIGIIIGVVVGAILTVLTAGAAAMVMVAVLGSLISTAATMGTKYLLLGNNYGSGDIAMDLAIGLVDAVVSGLTAGMGGRLLGQATQTAKAQATAITARGMRGALQRIGAGLGRARSSVAGFVERGSARIGGNEGLVTRMMRPSSTLVEMMGKGGVRAEAAQFTAAMLENLAQSAPSAIIGAVANDDVWEGRGNPFGKILSGTAQSLGPGLLMGAGMHGTMRVGGALGSRAGSAWHNFRHGPNLDVDVHAPRSIATGSEVWNERIAGYRQTWGSEGEARLRADLDLEFANASERFHMREAQRGPVREQLTSILDSDSSIVAEVPITMLLDADFRRLNGMRHGDAMVHVGDDGQVRVVVREGAPPAAVRRALEADLPRLRDIEPGTGGRIRTGRLESVLPTDVRGRLPVVDDPTLPPRTVCVVHDPEPRLIVGPGARAVDIATHMATARNVLQLHGAFGRVRQLLDNISDWIFLHGEPPINSRAWEAQEELRKLPGVIEARMRELGDTRLSPHQRAEIEADIIHFREQIALHQQTLADIDLRPGRGFIAADGRPTPTLAELDASHQRWTEQLRAAIRGEGPPPPAWRGREPELSADGVWRGHDPAEAYAAYRRALRDGGDRYEAIIVRDRLSGEYLVMLGREGSVSVPEMSPGRSWETVMHFHPNQEGALRFTLPAQQDLHTAMMERLNHAHAEGMPHIEFVESIINGQRTQVAIVMGGDPPRMHLEISRGAAGMNGPVAVSERIEIGNLHDYLHWWQNQPGGTPLPHPSDPGGTRWVPPESQAYRDLVECTARNLGHTDVADQIHARAPERVGVDADGTAHTMAGEIPPHPHTTTTPDPASVIRPPTTSGPPPTRVDTARLDEYPRTVVADSPLVKTAREAGGTVRQVGKEWLEGDGVYRYVEAVDSNGRVIASYGETRQNGTGPWVKRGSEINQQGVIGEIASGINVRSRMGPHDFQINGQNASGQGFDQVRIAFDDDAIIFVNGRPTLRDPNYVPRLIIGEDKFMASVSFDSITAINTNLISNLVDKIANNLVDMNIAAVRQSLATLGITPPHEIFKYRMLMRAVEQRNFHFEVSVINESSLAAIRLPDNSSRSPGDLQRLILHRLHLAIEEALGGHPVTITRIVMTDAELAQARQQLQAERRIGEITSVDRALGLPPASVTNEQLRTAFLATVVDSNGLIPGGLAPARVPGELISADGTPVRIIPADPQLASMRSIMPLGLDILRAMRPQFDAATGLLRSPVVVIDTTGMTPAHMEALSSYIHRFARHSYGSDAVARILTVDTASHRVVPFISLPGAQPL